MQLTSIKQGWDLVLNIGFGTGAVYILRWYWWRINAWSEISAMIAAAAVTIALQRCRIHRQRRAGLCQESADHRRDHNRGMAHCNFRDQTRVRINSGGVLPARAIPACMDGNISRGLVPELPEVRDLASNAFNWVMGVILVYGCLFGIGKLVFQQWFWGITLLAIAGVAGYLIFWDLTRRGWETLSGASATKNR